VVVGHMHRELRVALVTGRVVKEAGVWAMCTMCDVCVWARMQMCVCVWGGGGKGGGLCVRCVMFLCARECECVCVGVCG